MFSRTIFPGLILTIMMQVVVGQTSDGLSNLTNMPVRTPVSVSVGPIGVTNACLITTAQDAQCLRREIVLEVNKARYDLSLQNQQAIDSVREEYDKKYHVVVKQMNENVENWFGKMKGVLDEARDTNGKMINWIGVFFAVVGVIVAVVAGLGSFYSVIIPRRKERERDEEFKALTENLKNETKDQLKGAAQRWMSGYDDLRKNLDLQKSDYDKLLEELKNQKEVQSGLFEKLQDEMHAAIRKSERDVQWLKGKNEYDSAEADFTKYKHESAKAWLAAVAFQSYSMALYFFMSIKDVVWVRLTIWSMRNSSTTNVWEKNKEAIQTYLRDRDWEWDVPLNEVLTILKGGADDGHDYSGWIKELYTQYGKPKSDKQ